MPGSPSRTLRRKLFVIVMAAVSAAMAVSMGALLVHETLQYRRSGIEDLQAQAELLSKSLAPTLLFNDRRAAADTLATLKGQSNILVSEVSLPDGKPFASYRSTGAGGPAGRPRADAWAGLLSTQLELRYPITGQDEALGTLHLVARLDLASRMGGYALVLVAAALAGLALAALIFRRLHPQVTRPILAIEAASRRVTEERRYDISVGETSDGEIGRLIEAFDNMVRDLALQMQERQAAEQALREADRRKDEFLATLAHELRNPLAPIANAVALLDRARDDAALRAKATAIIKRQTMQMARLIDDLLEVSRITRGKLELRLEVLDAVAVARSALEAAEPVLRQHAHHVEVSLPAGPLYVRGDAARLMQVVVNLLNNAAKYTPPGGHVRLSASAESGQACITVQDDGIGIAPDDQQQVFDMFYQVDQSLGRGAAGLGVGLTIASQLVAMHQGRLEVHSAGKGQGSSFTVRLPLTDAAPAVASTAGTAGASSPPQGQGIDVLVADDNVDFADSFSSLLRAEGHRVQTVHDGAAAWSQMEQHWPRVAFLDVGMPGLDGLELARRARQQAGGRPITLVAVTGWGQAADRQRVMDAGFDLHWVKPIDPAQALELLRD